MTNRLFLTGLLVSALSLVAFSACADDWSYQIEPYGMIATIEGHAGIGRVAGADVNVDFGDILDALDMAFMGECTWSSWDTRAGLTHPVGMEESHR